MQKYLEQLNKEQYEAATSIEGINFILAGAGTGKTSTITARTAYMIDSGIDSREILLLTFTNKAAKEMKDRIFSLLGDKALGITACTFHSFCAIFIRRNAELMGFKSDYTILDSPDMMDALGIAKQTFFEEQKKIGKEYNLKDFPQTKKIGMVYEAAINNCVGYEDIVNAMPDIKMFKREVMEILQLFKHYKKDRNLMDYNDLLFYTEKLLSTDEAIRAEMDKRYKYISCDEYQDTNTIQNRILELMSRDYKNLTVVGDDNQSIYAFRYANIDNILNFDKVYDNCKTVVLNTNYRSSQNILDFANSVMKYAKEGKKKYLRGLFEESAPKIIVKNDCYEEADYIISKIVNRTCDLSDIAVICRSSSQTYILEQKLNAYGIPYNKYGGLKFMEKVVIKDMLAFLRASVNIKDEIAMFRILQLYPGIGKTYAKKISEIIASSDFDVAIDKYKKRVFAQYIIELKETIEKLSTLDLKSQMDFLINDYYKKTISRSIEQQAISDAKKSELFMALKDSMMDAEILATMASKYRSTSRFLNDIVLDATVEEENDDKLNITTIHSAKGLEYKVVFVMDCIEGVTPKCEEGDEEDPEELRCFYVAITRAKNELYLMIPRYYNMRNCRGIVSHFINKTDVLNTTQRNIQNYELLKMCQKEVYHF